MLLVRDSPSLLRQQRINSSEAVHSSLTYVSLWSQQPCFGLLDIWNGIYLGGETKTPCSLIVLACCCPTTQPANYCQHSCLVARGLSVRVWQCSSCRFTSMMSQVLRLVSLSTYNYCVDGLMGTTLPTAFSRTLATTPPLWSATKGHTLRLTMGRQPALTAA